MTWMKVRVEKPCRESKDHVKNTLQRGITTRQYILQKKNKTVKDVKTDFIDFSAKTCKNRSVSQIFSPTAIYSNRASMYMVEKDMIYLIFLFVVLFVNSI